MFVIRKNRIIFVFSIIVFMIFAGLILDGNIQNENNNTYEVVALPVTNKVIVIDARTSEFRMKVL